MRPFDRVLNLVFLVMALVVFATSVLEIVLMVFLNRRANELPWLAPILIIGPLLAWAAAVVADRRRQ